MTDVLHVIADVLLLVIVVWYDRRIEQLEADSEEYEAHLRTLRRRLDSLAERTPPVAGGTSGWHELWCAEPTCEA
ncbi:MAG: hypothetical protein IJS28_07300 [Synergistaceae bacterium]|nr:hypothetical protein [Synergistaceae bacterium]